MTAPCRRCAWESSSKPGRCGASGPPDTLACLSFALDRGDQLLCSALKGTGLFRAQQPTPSPGVDLIQEG